MFEDFDLDLEIDFDIDSNNRIENNFIKIKHDVKENNVVYDNAADLVEDIRIEKGETVFVNLSGDFVFGDFIGAFIQENLLEVKELTIISLSGGLSNFEMYDELLVQGWVEKLNIMLSGYFLRTELKKHTQTIQFLSKKSIEKKGIFNVYYTHTHAKIVLIETKQGGFVTISGSANLRSSQSLEQIIIQENKQLYDFQYNYFKSLINKK